MPDNRVETPAVIPTEYRGSRRRGWIVSGIVALALCAAAIVAFRGVGRWLVREDSLAHADVIVVLSGTMPVRAEEAANIFRMGYAREVWLTTPDSAEGELAEIGVHYVGEEEYNRETLLHGGVPADAIRVLPDPVVNTEQEIEEVSARMHREGEKTAIIVTSPQHTRRVGVLWRKLAGDGLAAIIRAAPLDGFDANHWWRDTRDVYAVIRELLGLVNAWTGLPVRPHVS